jgi:CDP-diacylglycerol--glycerol-3-phosphate 3-phosphatidyltransferase
MRYGNIIATVLFVLAAVTDFLDGYIARKRKQVTNLGKLLDPLADKLLVSAGLVVLIETGNINSWLAILIIGREFLVTGLRGVAATEGIVIAASKEAKVKTVTQIVAISLLLIEPLPMMLLGFSPGVWALYIAVAFTVYTGYDYVVKTFALINMN